MFCDKYFYFILNEYFFSIGHYLIPKLVVCCGVFVISISSVFVIICEKYILFVCIPSWWVVARCERQTTGLRVFRMYL